jgi:Flp pilus assembly protein TadG
LRLHNLDVLGTTVPLPPEIEAMLSDLQLRSARSHPAWPNGPWRRFIQNSDGATAVEFAMVAAPFFGLLFAIFQTAMVFWSTQVLETALANASRQIYTEQFKNSPENAGLDSSKSADLETMKKNFKKNLCGNVKGLFDCNNMVDIDIQIIGDFSSADIALPIVEKAYNTSSYKFQVPGRNEIVVVRASMEYPTFAMIGNPATSLASGNQLIIASAAFRTEP